VLQKKQRGKKQEGSLAAHPLPSPGLTTLVVLNVLVITMNHRSVNNSEQTTFVTRATFPLQILPLTILKILSHDYET